MESISRATRDKIASAPHYRCEYCQTAQEISGAQMHIEHIIPLSRGGRSDESNLCLACAQHQQEQRSAAPVLAPLEGPRARTAGTGARKAFWNF